MVHDRNTIPLDRYIEVALIAVIATMTSLAGWTPLQSRPLHPQHCFRTVPLNGSGRSNHKEQFSSIAWMQRNSDAACALTSRQAAHASCHRHQAHRHRLSAVPKPFADIGVKQVQDLAGDLPIRECIQDVVAGLSGSSCLVLQAPPGAGKTTVVPLALLLQGDDYLQGKQKILLLEPRRVAAKSAARRMAAQLGERVGETVGYRWAAGSWCCSDGLAVLAWCVEGSMYGVHCAA
jgi:hypothetical protein